MNKLTIYFTSDTHGYLYPTNFCDQQPHPMGLLSMRFPKDENTLIIDGGDTIQGSPLTYFCHVTGQQAPVAAALNDRGYDYVTLGNHDFNYGPENLGRYLHALHAKCLCANVRDEQGRLPLFPSIVHTLGNGLRVGLVGIVTDWVNRWEKKENLVGLTVSDPLAAAREAIKDLKCDILVGIYHGGIERDLQTGRLLSDTDENIACRLCEELPFDLLLTGHQHIALAGGQWQGVHIVQTPCNAAAYVKVTMDENKRFSSELCPVPDHADLTEEESALFARLNDWLDTPVGQRIENLLFRGAPVAPDQHFSLCMCDYRATGAGDFDFYRVCPHIRDIQTDISELILDYLRAHNTVQIPEKSSYRVLLP